MQDYLFASIGALATLLGFGYWILKATLVTREEFEKKVDQVWDVLNKRERETIQEHNKLASKQELRELELAFRVAIEKIESTSKELDTKIYSIQRGILWIMAKSGAREEMLETIFKKED